METEQQIFWTEYVDGTFAECRAYDEVDAENIMARPVEMVHGPVAGRAPCDPNSEKLDRYFTEYE